MGIGHFEFYRGTWSSFFHFYSIEKNLWHFWHFSSKSCQLVVFGFLFFFGLFMRNVWKYNTLPGSERKEPGCHSKRSFSLAADKTVLVLFDFLFVFFTYNCGEGSKKVHSCSNYLFTFIPHPLFLDELIFVMIDV